MSHLDFNRVFDLLPYQQEKYPQPKSLNQWEDDHWVHYSTEQIQKRVNHISAWLTKNGYHAGDKVALMPRMGSAH